MEVRESARQTEITSRALQVAAYQDLITRISELNTLAMQDENFSAVSNELNPGPISREDFFALTLFRLGDLAYYQYQLGLLTEDRMESSAMILTARLCQPEIRDTWERFGKNFAGEYQEFIDQRIAQCGATVK